jgi:superfamily II DNA or RNA helicase
MSKRILYKDYKAVIQPLCIENDIDVYSKFIEFTKSDKWPKGYPKTPPSYFDREFKLTNTKFEIGDLLDTGSLHKLKEISYEDYKAVIQPLCIENNIDTQTKLNEFVKTDKWPKGYSKAPASYFDNFSIYDLLNKDGSKLEDISYEDYKAVIQPLCIENDIDIKEKFLAFTKTDQWPKKYTGNPRHFFRNEFIEKKIKFSWGDLLGTNSVNKLETILYEDYKAVIQPLCIENGVDTYPKLREFVKTDKWPNGYSKDPKSYFEKEFKSNGNIFSIGDLLGTGRIANQVISRERKQEVLDFITKLEPVMKTLSSINLIVIIQAAKNGYFLETLRKNTAFKRLINADTEEQQSKAYEDLRSDFTNDTDTYDEDDFDITEDKTLTSGRRLREMKAIDMVNLSSFMDNEVYIFLQESYMNEWMNIYVNDKATFEDFKNEEFQKNGFSDTLRTKLLEKIYNIENWDYRGSIEGDTYIFPHDLYMEQKVFAYEMYERNSYMNLSLPGAGKTLPCVVVSKLIGVCNTLIITCNATIGTWVKEINKSFKNNHIVIREDLKGGQKCTFDLSGTKWNYLILNYEYFQQGLNNDILDILNTYYFAAVIIDEIQKAKQTTEKEESIRRKTLLGTLDKIYKDNDSFDTKVMSLTGTPVINNLYEAKTLLELALNKSFPEISGKNDVNNAIMIHTQLVNNGIRFKPQYNIDMDINHPIIDGQELVNDLLLIDKKHPTLPIERTILNLKLEATKHLLKKGTLIYCEYIDGLVLPIKEFCEQQGFSVGLFIGDDKAGKDKFVNGQVDILIGSSCINTGIDGLQNVSDNMIVYSLPWTNANWIQLIGRLYRPGQTNKVTITVPMINIETDCQIWSWDKHRVDRINWKKTLADCAVDGNIPSDKIMDRASLEKTAINSLIEWKKRIEENGMNSIDRTADEVILEELDEDNRRKFKLGRFSEMNQNWSVSNSDTIQKQLKDNPEDWFEYHELYKEATKNWLEVPVYNIADRIEEGAIVGDFGCGENLLSKKIYDKNIVYPFDYIAVDDSVIECDIKNTNLPDETLDVAVICLALMGRNCKDYIKEAYRTLSVGGKLHIAEPASKWKNNEKRLKDIIESCGFTCSDVYKNTDKFIYIDGIKI